MALAVKKIGRLGRSTSECPSLQDVDANDEFLRQVRVLLSLFFGWFHCLGNVYLALTCFYY